MTCIDCGGEGHEDGTCLAYYATAPDATAEIDAMFERMSARHGYSVSDLRKYTIPEGEIERALSARKVFEALAPDLNFGYVYALFARPASEHPECWLEDVQVRQLTPDWTARVPHAYVQSSTPLKLPGATLIRRGA